MGISQIILFIIGALILYTYGRRFFLVRSIKHYDPVEAAEKLKTRSVLLLDVRTPAERNQHHIKGSIHIPLNQLRSRVDELKKYKNKEIICYCRTGNRSISAASTLKKHGFSIANLRGGIVSWNSKNLK